MELREKVRIAFENDNHTDAIFIGISGNRMLWHCLDTDLYCVNTFEILEDGTVEFSPMPVESFD